MPQNRGGTERTMKILKNSIIISSYVLLTALFFFGGYAVGNIGSKKDIVLVTPEPVKAADAAISGKQTYRIVLENGELNFYSIQDGEEHLITSEKISENIYPGDDIADLTNGVNFDNIEDAQAMFENFVS